MHLIQDPGSPIIANKLNKTDALMLRPLVFTVTKRLHFPKSLDVPYGKQQRGLIQKENVYIAAEKSTKTYTATKKD